MKKQQLNLHTVSDGGFRTVIKNSHGRLIYLEVVVAGDMAAIRECYYIDRVRSGEYYAVPKELKTLSFKFDEILLVIERELDRKYFGINYDNSLQGVETGEFIKVELAKMQRNYSFLIFMGDGELIDGIPSVIRTRLKNRIHRGIFIEMRYIGNGKGVITDCYYYDRIYKERSKVTPENLTTVFFQYSRQAILNIINNELNTAFTHIIFVTDPNSGLNINDEVALCGNI